MTDNGQPADGMVAVLHAVGPMLRVVAGRLEPAPAVAAWTELRRDQPQKLSAWLRDQGVGSVIAVLPPSAVVCRTCTLPDADEEHLRRALDLQAEAQMLAEVPDHRQARAVLPIAEGETSRSGIMVAWPPRPTDEGLPAVAGFETSWAAAVAALAGLLNGRRSQGPMVWFDRGDGSVTLAISHANGAVFRAARVGDGDAWTDNVGRVLAETALSVGHTARYTEELVAEATSAIAGIDHAAGLTAPPDVLDAARQRLAGAPADAAWWRDYGVAAGTLLAAAGPLAPLTRLRLEAPLVAPSLSRRLAAAFSEPASASRIVVICLLVIFIGPLVLSGLRLGLLKLKLSNIDTYLTEARAAEVKLAMYREMKDKTWPMSKLLSDIACNTPESIDIDQIRIRFGEKVTVMGRAKENRQQDLSAQQVVAQMQDHLRATGIFEEIYLSWGDPNAFDAYEFTLSASVVNAYRRHVYPPELDYGTLTLAERLYGTGDDDESASVTLVESPGDEDVSLLPPRDDEARTPPEDDLMTVDPEDEILDDGDEEGRPAVRQKDAPTRRLPRPGAAGSTDGPRSFDDRRIDPGSIPASRDVPEPLTPEQIQVMTLEEAKEALSHLSQALQRARVDKETKDRLWADWRAVRQHWRELDKRSRAGEEPEDS